ncbi:MAG: hypothetical protein ABI337_07940, partial [Nitrososphaera sp.]
MQKYSDRTLQPRSFVITPITLSITVRKDVQEIKPESIIEIDRNLRNITISTPHKPSRTGQTSYFQSRKTPSLLKHHLGVMTGVSKIDSIPKSEAD